MFKPKMVSNFLCIVWHQKPTVSCSLFATSYNPHFYGGSKNHHTLTNYLFPTDEIGTPHFLRSGYWLIGLALF